MTTARPESEQHAASRRPLVAAAATTAVVTALSYLVPPEHAASAVGMGFLVATYLLTLRGGDPGAASHYGLSLGGLLELEPIDYGKLVKSAATELAIALALIAIVVPFFWLGFTLWWKPGADFRGASLSAIASEALGQLLVIALPEEAFYRGFLQTSLDDAWPPRVRVLGATLGPSLLVTSLVFALGHVATEVHPSRLAVFFPSLLFGYLRSKRGGIGAASAFHAACNLLAAYVARSYGMSG